jgi:hypothetical protein
MHILNILNSEIVIIEGKTFYDNINHFFLFRFLLSSIIIASSYQILYLFFLYFYLSGSNNSLSFYFSINL